MSDFYDDAAVSEGASLLGPIFIAEFETDCSSCPDMIEPGDRARADGAGTWIHATLQCERVAKSRHTATASAACPECFCVHAGHCYE